MKDLLPKLSKQSKNGTLPSIEPSPLPKRCVQLPPITSWAFINDNLQIVSHGLATICRRSPLLVSSLIIFTGCSRRNLVSKIIYICLVGGSGCLEAMLEWTNSCISKWRYTWPFAKERNIYYNWQFPWKHSTCKKPTCTLFGSDVTDMTYTLKIVTMKMK